MIFGKTPREIACEVVSLLLIAALSLSPLFL